MLTTYLAVILIAFAGGLTQAITGLGAAAVMMAVMPWFFNMLEAPAICQLVCMAQSGTLLLRLRKHVNLKRALPPTVVYTALSVLSIRVAKGLNLNLLTAIFGGFLVLLALWFCFFEGKFKVPTGTGAMLGCSSLSGMFSGFFGVGGPTMALWMLSAFGERMAYLAALQLLFFTSNTLSTVTRIASGILTWNLIPPALAGMVGIMAGQTLGLKLAPKLKPEWFRRAVYIVVGLSGLIQLVNQIF